MVVNCLYAILCLPISNKNMRWVWAGWQCHLWEDSIRWLSLQRLSLYRCVLTLGHFEAAADFISIPLCNVVCFVSFVNGALMVRLSLLFGVRREFAGRAGTMLIILILILDYLFRYSKSGRSRKYSILPMHPHPWIYPYISLLIKRTAWRWMRPNVFLTVDLTGTMYGNTIMSTALIGVVYPEFVRNKQVKAVLIYLKRKRKPSRHPVGGK